MSDNEIPTPAMRSMSEEQFDTQRATMHYVRTLAILAGLFVYTSFVSAIVGLGLLGSLNADGGGAAFGAIVVVVGGIALFIGFIILLTNFISAFRTANKWAKRLAVNPFDK